MRRQVLGSTGWLALVALVGACGLSSEASGPRNVILISLDTLRADHLGCYGRGRNTSPTIDSIAASGVRFADASAASPWTLPSHATLLTGLYPSRHGVKDYVHTLPAERETLAELLAARGFQNSAVLNTWSLADQRFALMQGFEPDRVRYIPEVERTPGQALKSVNRAREVVRSSREMLLTRDKTRPFFLFVHFYDAHTDFAPRLEYRKRLVTPYQGPIDGTTRQLLQLRRKEVRLSATDLRFLRELYDAEIRQLDDALAELFAMIEEQSLLGDSLIVLTSDHGEEFQEHGGLLHGRTQYQELLAVPLIFKGPGVPRGRVVTEPVSLVDVVPTILALLGHPAAAAGDGVDLSPSWAEPARALPERPLFGEADHSIVDGRSVSDTRRMVRLGHEKLCSDRVSGRSELYDLGGDPAEQQDLSAERPERVALLSAALALHLGASASDQLSPNTLSAEQLELLRSLGYVDDSPTNADQR